MITDWSRRREREKILLITRKYPPSVGGMETAAYELYSALH